MSHSVFEEDSLTNQRLKCVTLLLDCPLHRTAATCPFRKIREESVVTRVNWLKSLDAKRVLSLLLQHEKCMAVPAPAAGKRGEINSSCAPPPVP